MKGRTMISERIVPSPASSAERGLTIPLGAYGHRISLAAVLILAAVLDFYGLAKEGYSNTYYAAVVRSMAENWHAFFFNSLDPAGFVSIDKPPLGFWLQVASVKLFGFNGVSLMLPQALAGVISAGMLYYLVGRTFGRPAGLIAALALALTPISVVSNRNNIIDSTLVCVLLFGAWAITRAVETGKLRWLLLCAVFVGLGFNIKMLEAYLVVPAFGLTYLLGSRLHWHRRLLYAVPAAAVLLVVSLSWAVAVDLTPASQRPWVGSTTDNSELSLAIGYNGLQRLTGNSSVGGRGGPGSNGGRPAGGSAAVTANRIRAGNTTGLATGTRAANNAPPDGNVGGPGGVGENGPIGPLRLLNTQLGTQIGWLLPLAAIGLLLVAWQTRRRSRQLDDRQSALVLWGMWLATMVPFFSIAGFFHTYYLVMVAPGVAALSGIGITALWRAYRQHGSQIWWLLPVSLLAVAVIQVHLLVPYPQWAQWLTPLIIAGCLLAATLLTLLRLRPRLPARGALPAAVLGALVLLAGPATWSVASVSAADSGPTPRAGPAGTAGMGGPGGFAPAGAGAFQPPNGNAGPPGAPGNPPPSNGNSQPPAGGFGPASGGGSSQQPNNGFAPPGRSQASASGSPNNGTFRPSGGGPGGNSVNRQLVRYLEQHQGKATYLFATNSAGTAEPYIIATGKAVMATGGFTGSDPILTTSKLAALVKGGVVRYFLLGGGGPGGNGGISSWVQQHCSTVPTSKYSSSTSAARSGGGEQLYDCGVSA